MSTRAPRYPADLKAAVVSHAEHHGFAATYEQWPNIEPATIRSWCSRAGVATGGTEKTRAATEYVKACAEERRARLADRMLDLAEMATDQAEALIGEANLRDVVGLFTRAVHDHQLLSGQATTRSELLEPARDAEALLDELAQRRKRNAA